MAGSACVGLFHPAINGTLPKEELGITKMLVHFCLGNSPPPSKKNVQFFALQQVEDINSQNIEYWGYCCLQK